MKLIFNVHSYGQHILYPWGYTYTPLQDTTVYSALASGIAAKMTAVRNNTFQSGQWSDLLNYLGSGVTEDWAWHDEGIYCLGSELYPSTDPPGFVIPESAIQPAVSEFIPGALYAIEWVNQPVPIRDWYKYSNPNLK